MTAKWSGFYAGLTAGATWSNSPSINVTNRPAPGSSWGIFNSLASGIVATSNQSGFIGGGQIGYNWETRLTNFGIVTGVEADIQGNTGPGGGSNGISNYSPNTINISVGTVSVTANTATSVTGSQKLNYLGTIRSRVGYLITPTLLA